MQTWRPRDSCAPANSRKHSLMKSHAGKRVLRYFYQLHVIPHIAGKHREASVETFRSLAHFSRHSVLSSSTQCGALSFRMRIINSPTGDRTHKQSLYYVFITWYDNNIYFFITIVIKWRYNFKYNFNSFRKILY